jgi:hypothetical protein
VSPEQPDSAHISLPEKDSKSNTEIPGRYWKRRREAGSYTKLLFLVSMERRIDARHLTCTSGRLAGRLHAHMFDVHWESGTVWSASPFINPMSARTLTGQTLAALPSFRARARRFCSRKADEDGWGKVGGRPVARKLATWTWVRPQKWQVSDLASAAISWAVPFGHRRAQRRLMGVYRGGMFGGEGGRES